MKHFSLLIFSITLFSCAPEEQEGVKEKGYAKDSAFTITELSDEEYPANPTIGYRSKDHLTNYFSFGKIEPDTGNLFDLYFYAGKNGKDSIFFDDIDLQSFIPAVPEYFREDDYLSYLAVVNQEWNRNQVAFGTDRFVSSNKKIRRVDIARNCLNAYLWEIIAFTMEDGKEKVLYHGWFDFPRKIYQDLFTMKNGIAFEQYEKPLTQWVDPESKVVNQSVLRKVLELKECSFKDKSDTMYPVAGAREKKYRLVLQPDTFSTMRDLQTDSTRFATFSPPGFYDIQQPRKTELGRFYRLDAVKASSTLSKSTYDTLTEIQMVFSDRGQGRKTTLVLGGLDLDNFPELPASEANNGWKSSMGLSNHTFYEGYDEHLEHDALHNPYYAYLIDKDNKWLDSHYMGIDGPVFHYDEEGNLHLWLLSFERHSLVGHYILSM